MSLNKVESTFSLAPRSIPKKPLVYIGQAGARKNGKGILYRLQEHRRNPEKDYWNEAVVFTTSNNSLGSTEISYLENRFCNLALGAKRYEVKNGNEPNLGHITEEKESEMEEFIDNAKIIIGILGHKLFVPLSIPSSGSDEKTMLFLERTIREFGKVEARGYQSPEGFVVLKGSHISSITDDTIPESIKKRRENAKTEENILLEDQLFSSPSYAAYFVVGKSTNGLSAWKTSDGKTLKEIEREECEN